MKNRFDDLQEFLEHFLEFLPFLLSILIAALFGTFTLVLILKELLGVLFNVR